MELTNEKIKLEDQNGKVRNGRKILFTAILAQTFVTTSLIKSLF